MKIIIVDDDCLVAGALKTILEANPDIEVTATGSDGEEACSLYREYLPDILLMDIRMKGNGRTGSFQKDPGRISGGKNSSSDYFFR